MPNARKITFGTYVVPTFSIEMEETAITHTEFQASPNGTLGGKGVATINATQWDDDWTSMSHPEIQLWEEAETEWEDVIGESWEAFGTGGGNVTITTTLADHQLSSDGNDLAFLYIKNTGDTEVVGVSLTGSSGTRVIYIPPNGSVHLRGDGTNLDCDDIYVRAEANTTTIEYIIAKE